VEVVGKPGTAYSVKDVSRQLAQKIRAAASAKVAPAAAPAGPSAATSAGASAPVPAPPAGPLRTTHRILAVGASTGGTRAIEDLFGRLPADTAGTVIVQHMPEHFTRSFADRLNQLSPMEIREAVDRELIVPGLALIAPGNQHMVVRRNGAKYLVGLRDGPPVHYQRPSVDVLFHSVARQVGPNAVGVILTGMGADGAAGLLAMHQAGAWTLAQDEASCVVFGMPREAIALGAADEVASLAAIPGRIVDSLARPAKAAATVGATGSGG
jgi:two-component system chemotaxis response regulator CheB